MLYNYFYYLKLSFFAVTGVVLAVFTSSCSSETSTNDTLSAFVSIQPQKYFLEQIGGSHVETHVLLDPGANPATYSPNPQRMSELAKADVFFRIDVPFEKGFIPKVKENCPDLPIIDVTRNIALRSMRAHTHQNETTAAEDETANGPKNKGRQDPHTWMNPLLAIKQVRTMTQTLCELDPMHSDHYKQNMRDVVKKLRELDLELRDMLKPYKGECVFVFHPAYGYFTDAYNLKQCAIQVEGKNPSARQLSRLIDRLKKKNAKVIFVQPEFSSRDAETIANAVDASVVPLDPLAEDYMENMRKIGKRIANALGDTHGE